MQPEDYEPPFFRCCEDTEQLTWAVTPLKMKVGDVDSKHYSIALKVIICLQPFTCCWAKRKAAMSHNFFEQVRSILDPCDNDEQMESQSEAASDSEDDDSHNVDAAEKEKVNLG